MQCRPGCGACCIAPHISSAIPGMPEGKPAGVRCINLDAGNNCLIWQRDDYPLVCQDFTAHREHCADNRLQALQILTRMEDETRPD
nr:YkgJ family cysteine cluster protein [Aliamphritea hakodatensis]